MGQQSTDTIRKLYTKIGKLMRVVGGMWSGLVPCGEEGGVCRGEEYGELSVSKARFELVICKALFEE